MKKLMLVAMLATCSGCVSYNLDTENVCKQNSFEFNVPDLVDLKGNLVGTVSKSYSVDFSSNLKDVNSLGADVKLTVTKNNLVVNVGDLSWVENVKLSVEGKQLPSVMLVNETLKNKQSTYNLTTLVDGNVLYDYFSKGEVKFTLTVTPVSLPVSSKLDNSICFSLNLNGKKSL
jgi:hypothetical protein